MFFRNYQTILDHSTERRAPLVTVGITMFNYGCYIEECLESVFNQTIPGIDLVLVDDCSKDDSLETARRCLEKTKHRFKRARLLKHRRNQGLAAARNTMFKAARTPYVFVLDADNKLLPTCLAEHIKVLEGSTADFAYGVIATFGQELTLHSAIEWIPGKLRKRNCYDAMALIRKSAWKSCGGYSLNMPAMGWEDYDFWLKCHLLGMRGLAIPKILSLYRVHSTSMINLETNPRAKILKEHMEKTYPSFFSASDSAVRTASPALPNASK